MTYGILLWGHLPAAKRIFILQKKAVRLLVYDAKKCVNFSCRGLFKRHGLLILTCAYVLSAVNFVKTHPQITESNTVQHSYCTRQFAKLCLPKYRTDYLGKGCLCSALRVYNHLPGHLTDPSSINVFKHNFKKILIKKTSK